MPDLTDKESSQTIKIVGSDSSGVETNFAKVSSNFEIGVNDSLDNGGLDAVLNLTTTAQEAKVGASAKTNRKYLIAQAITVNVKWGFTNSTQSFDLFINQMAMIPCGPNTSVWFKVSAGTGQVAIGEVS